MATSSNPFDLAEKQYSEHNPFDLAEEHYQKPKNEKFKLELTPAQRVGGQLLSRGAERVLGFPREAAEFLEQLVPEKLITKGAEKIGLGEPVEKGFELAKKYAPYKLLPREQDVRNFTNTIFKGKLEPKNEWEKKAADSFADFVGLALPVGGELKLLRPALVSVGGNLAKETADFLGYPESAGELAKLGVFGLSAFLHPKSAKKFYEENYAKAREVLPPNATVSSTTLENELNHLEASFRRGGVTTAEKHALEIIENVRKEMQGDQIPVESLTELKKKINIVRGEIRKALEGNKPGIKRASRNLDQVANAVDDSLKLYGRYNPHWESFYRPANEAFAADEQSRKALKYVARNIKKIGIGHTLGGAVLYHLLGLQGIGVGVGSALAAYPAAKIGETIVKMWKSPSLRKYFFNLYKGALQESLPDVVQNAKKLEKALDKDSAK